MGEAVRCATKLSHALGLGEAEVGRVAQVVAQAAANIAQHAQRGEILLRPYTLESPASLEMLALDQGAGMANVAQAVRDGFSTAGSPGLGLGAIARNSNHFEISSTPGKGTALLARIGPVTPVRPAQHGLEWGAVCVSKRDEEVCGDAWAVKAGEGWSTILIVDGLGHGLLAFDAAEEARRAFCEHAGGRPESIIKGMHEAMHATRKTRGAVAAIAEIDWLARELRYAGAGNIAGTLVPVRGMSTGLVSHNGTLGQSITRVHAYTYPWPDKGHLILHSDGLSTHWALDAYPGLTQKDPSLIAGVLYRDFASRRDDVVVFVGRERKHDTNTPGPGGESP